MDQNEVITILKRSNALVEAETPSGYAIDADRLLEDPIVTNSFVVEGFRRFDPSLQKTIKCILAPASDMLFGFAAATAAWARAIHAHVGEEGVELAHGYAIAKGEGVVIAITDLTDAAELAALVSLVEAAEAKVVGVLTIANNLAEAPVKPTIYSLL